MDEPILPSAQNNKRGRESSFRQDEAFSLDVRLRAPPGSQNVAVTALVVMAIIALGGLAFAYCGAERVPYIRDVSAL